MTNKPSPLFHRLRSRQEPTATDVREDVIEFHTRKPGAAEATYGQCKTAEGKTSYELLATSVGDLTDRIVVDLACGNGPLLEHLFHYYTATKRERPS